VRRSGTVHREFRIQRTAAGVEVLAGAAPVFRKLATGPVGTTPPDSAGRYTIPLSTSRP